LQGVCKNREDRESVPCGSCPRSFPSRRHLQEHRRSKHREEREETGLLTNPQNMGHSVGQYFSVGRSQPSARPQLPPFACPAGPALRCEVCHATFPSELALSRHFPTHWAAQPGGQEALHHHKVTGADLPLPLPHHEVEDNVGSLLRQVYHTEHTDFGPKLQTLGHGAEAYPMEYPAYDSFLYFNA
jgi:hypothetical protein